MIRNNLWSQISRKIHHQSYKTRKTGRTGHNCILPKQAWRFELAKGRTFQREVGKRFGYDLGLEDKILLCSLGQKNRRLDEKKTRQLNNILEMKIGEATSSNELISSLAVQFSKVKVNSSFTEVVIYWLCSGQNDEEICSALESERHSIRRALSDAVGTNCPELRFVPDRSNLLVEEMERLFKKADYGTDYRTLSHTARILGNVEATSEKEERKKPPPAWKLELLKNKETSK